MRQKRPLWPHVLVLAAMLSVPPLLAANASTFASAIAQNNLPMSVTSSSVSLVAVATASSPNTFSSYVVPVSKTAVGFFAVNFGSRDIYTFTISQDTDKVNLRYCVSGFSGNVASHKCVDGSNPVLVSSTLGSFVVPLTSPIVPGGSLQFSAESKTVTSEIVSISVGLQ